MKLDFKFNDSGAHGSEHIAILLNAAGQKWRAAMDVFSSNAPREILMAVHTSFSYPGLSTLSALDTGLADIRTEHSTLSSWTAVFCAFQSQSWNNDDAQGNPIN